MLYKIRSRVPIIHPISRLWATSMKIAANMQTEYHHKVSPLQRGGQVQLEAREVEVNANTGRIPILCLLLFCCLNSQLMFPTLNYLLTFLLTDSPTRKSRKFTSS